MPVACATSRAHTGGLVADRAARRHARRTSTEREDRIAMKYRLLGRTGLYVSELCLGTMTYGSAGFWEGMGGLDQQAVNAQVNGAFEAGINFIDTANVYSFGQSERARARSARSDSATWRRGG